MLANYSGDKIFVITITDMPILAKTCTKVKVSSKFQKVKLKWSYIKLYIKTIEFRLERKLNHDGS